jgi:hypothetical protein
MAEIDQIPTSTTPWTVRDYVDKLMYQQSRLIVAAVKYRQQINADNLNKRYSTYPRTPKLWRFSERAGTKPIWVHSIGTRSTGSSTQAQKWIVDPNDQPFIGSLNQGKEGPPSSYIPLLSTTAPGKIVDTIDQIDLNP